MKKITLLLLSTSFFLIMSGCLKNLDPASLIPNLPNQPEQATPTTVGYPAGAVVTQSIGKSGGSIVSADGIAELVFPANALDHNTDISMQAITNNAPNGVGYAYRLLPEGITFSQPVLLKFHYTAEDLASTLADLMGIAFQDSTGIWYRLNNYTNDTVSKVVSAPIKHFTDYTNFDIMRIHPVINTIQVNKSQTFEVDVIETSDDELTQLKGDDVAPLIVTASKTIIWSVNGVVNGNSTIGTVSGTDLLTTYQAPAKVPKNNPVAIGAQVDVHFKAKGMSFNKTSLVTYVKVIDAEKFKLDLVVTEQEILMTYTDQSDMIVLVKPDGTIVVSDINNYAPASDPTNYIDGDCTFSWVPDAIGEMNIVSATGYLTGTEPKLTLEFKHKGTLFPKFNTDCGDGNSEAKGGFAIEGFPSDISFILNKDSSTFVSDDGHLKGTLTRTN